MESLFPVALGVKVRTASSSSAGFTEDLPTDARVEPYAFKSGKINAINHQFLILSVLKVRKKQQRPSKFMPIDLTDEDSIAP
jgi:hypothetical protein